MEHRHLYSAIACAQSAILAETDKETRYFATLAANRTAQYLRNESGLRTFVQVPYRVAGRGHLILDVYFSGDEDGIEEASAYVGDSAINIAPLLDWDELCELIDKECHALAEQDAEDRAAAWAEGMAA